MKQQQESAGFLGARASYCCRFYNAGPENCADLGRDVISAGRYHYQVLDNQQESLQICDQARRHKFLIENGLRPETPILQILTPSLDLVLDCLPDPAHSEFYGLVRKLYPLLNSKILTKRAAAEFATVFYWFAFSPGLDRIQFPTVHMQSWSMSECGRASIIVPMLLRVWLKTHHLRQSYKNELRIAFPEEHLFYNPSVVDLVVFCFRRLAKSNSIISFFQRSQDNQNAFYDYVITARECFIGLMNAGGDLREKKKKKKGKKKGQNKNGKGKPSSDTDTALAISSWPGSMSGDHPSEDDQNLIAHTHITNSAANSENSFIETPVPVNRNADKLSNFHVGIHFERINNEIAGVWNSNVFWGENKHRKFKTAVFATNHQKPEKQLLMKNAVLATMRALLNGSFFHTDLKISMQMAHLRA